jgi:hypothetical protein
VRDPSVDRSSAFARTTTTTPTIRLNRSLLNPVFGRRRKRRKRKRERGERGRRGKYERPVLQGTHDEPADGFSGGLKRDKKARHFRGFLYNFTNQPTNLV